MKQSRILHSILLIMESVLFGMFVIAIACDQFEAIFSDETLVEQAKKQVGEQYTDESDDHVIPVLLLQGPYRPRRPRVALLAEVCGRGHPVTWLLPCHTSDTRDWEPLQNYDV